jgi:hypothetical protein
MCWLRGIRGVASICPSFCDGDSCPRTRHALLCSAVINVCILLSLILSCEQNSELLDFWISSRTNTNPVSETLCSLEYRTLDKVQESSTPKLQNPSKSIVGKISLYPSRRNKLYLATSVGHLQVVIFNSLNLCTRSRKSRIQP